MTCLMDHGNLPILAEHAQILAPPETNILIYCSRENNLIIFVFGGGQFFASTFLFLFLAAMVLQNYDSNDGHLSID